MGPVSEDATRPSTLFSLAVGTPGSEVFTSGDLPESAELLWNLMQKSLPGFADPLAAQGSCTSCAS